MDRAATADKIGALIAPFNKKGLAITDASTFSGDLEFDIIISMNQQAEIETYGQLIDAVVKLKG